MSKDVVPASGLGSAMNLFRTEADTMLRNDWACSSTSCRTMCAWSLRATGRSDCAINGDGISRCVQMIMRRLFSWLGDCMHQLTHAVCFFSCDDLAMNENMHS